MASSYKLKIERPVFEQEQLNQACDYAQPRTNIVAAAVRSCRGFRPSRCLQACVPALGWLSSYSWREDLPGDLIAGITVAIMHIPQGMAYALLGNVPPVVGIYMAFFPVLAYVLLGTSRHVSMGTFAVICLMTGKTVSTHSYHGDPGTPANLTLAASAVASAATAAASSGTLEERFTPIEVATAVTFMVAIYQLVMWVCRAGIVCTLLSETLVNGFTAGAAVHVLASQVKDLLGIDIVRYKGPFKIIFTVRDIIQQISTANLAAVLISSITLLVLVVNNELIKKWFAKRSKVPVPIELLVVVAGTLVSSYGYLEESYGITTVGHIPTGLPTPSLPPFSLLARVAADSFTITMVAYTISMSMALIFAQKLNYEVDANQECLAQGAGNLVGSFFSCMPFTASLSRSLIQQAVGGKTQLASVVSCGLLLVVLLWIGPFFEPLPRCVLASIIVVALKGMFMQVKDFVRFWRCSFLDGVVWLATFLTVVFVDIDFGLLTGVLLSLASILIQSMKPYICLVGVVPGTDLYLDINRYKGTTEIPGIKIFHYCGGLNFASRAHFRREVYRLVDVCPQRVVARRKELARKNEARGGAGVQKKLKDGIPNPSFEDDYGTASPTPSDHQPVLLKYLVVDFSALSYIDPSGVNALQALGEDFQKIDIPLYIAGISGPVYEALDKCGLLTATAWPLRIFPTVHDAVIYAKTKMNEDQMLLEC